MHKEVTYRGIVEQVVNGGWGIVRCNEGLVFLNYVITGEEVEYKIKENSRGVLWGELIRVIKDSAHRIQPACQYYGTCGGCNLQHVDYTYQKLLKKNILYDNLRRMGKIEKKIDTFFSSPPYHYRVRIKLKTDAEGKIGYIKKGTNTIVSIKKCLLVENEVNEFLRQWNEQEKIPFFYQYDILKNMDNDRIFIHLSNPPDREAQKILDEFKDITFSSKKNLSDSISNLSINKASYLVSPAAFFQVNFYLWEEMLSAVDSMVAESETAIDLYTGVGFFLPVLLDNSRIVYGVESNNFSVQLARESFPEVKIYKTTAEKFFFPVADILLVDPPRSGLSKIVMKKILQRKYPKIIYISCFSATFARDAGILEKNGYKISRLYVFDNFPQTSHLEVISLLEYQ